MAVYNESKDKDGKVMDDLTLTDERKAVIATLLFDWTLETTRWKASERDEQIESLQAALAELPGESLGDYRRFWRWARAAEPNSFLRERDGSPRRGARAVEGACRGP